MSDSHVAPAHDHTAVSIGIDISKARLDVARCAQLELASHGHACGALTPFDMPTSCATMLRLSLLAGTL